MILSQLESGLKEPFLEYFSAATYRTICAQSAYPVHMTYSNILAASVDSKAVLRGAQAPRTSLYLPTLATGIATVEQKVNFLLQLVKRNISISDLLNYKAMKTNSLRRYAGIVSASGDFNKFIFQKKNYFDK